uniref:Uncharacterized protein n=1 Tax=Oryza glumipatula TaxID=40148 RepID=A0A0D9Y2D0_9ORYZ
MSATAPTTNAETNGRRRPATGDAAAVTAATLEKGGGRRGDEGEEKVRRLARGRLLARRCRSAPPTARLPAAVGVSLRQPLTRCACAPAAAPLHSAPDTHRRPDPSVLGELVYSVHGAKNVLEMPLLAA